MIINQDGDVIITNDGSTIIKNMNVEHPIAKLLVDLSLSQDDEIGDGTTGVVILAGALLEQAMKLLDKGLHPLQIIEGFDKGCKYALDNLEEIKFDKNNNDELKNAAKNALCSKVVSKYQDKFAEIAVNALRHATEESFGTEFQSYTMAVKTVTSLDEAIQHIFEHGSGHSECIITENEQTADEFTRQVDAACVYTNAPTSFTDGAQFGLGAEIGISTQKLHARGPMALEEICSYKWIIKGNGQTRPK